MSRRRTAPSVHRLEHDAHDLLAGRTPLSPGDLIACIHAVNPTGRLLVAADARRRYELKARLQSLLIRRFHDDLEVTAEGRGVVAIRHRYLAQDACHARIDELEEDARAQVRWLLDVGESSEDASEGQVMPSGAQVAALAGPLEQGRAALAEFDYDAARAHFERAAVDGGDDPTAARALLGLLVDHLALDDQALAIEHGLPARVAADGEVRALLAVAASRTGNAAAAYRLLHGLGGTRAADAWCGLAEDAIRRQAYDDLDRCIARLTESDPAHPEIIRLREAANRLRADARRPAEQELLRFAEDGDDAAALAMARKLLDRWPDSPVAGRIVSRIYDRRRNTEADRLVAGTRVALSDGDVERATELCRQARAIGVDTKALMEQIRELDAVRRHAQEAAELAAVCSRLADADPRPGLAAFLALEPDLRRRVRSCVDAPILEWLEQAQLRHKGARPGAIIDAVLAIGAAAEAIARGDDGHALAVLTPHGPLIAGVARANELRAEAQRRIAARRRDAASDVLDRAQRALAAGDLELCERLCDRTARRDLDATPRVLLEQVRRAVREQRDIARRRARVDELVGSGDLVTARRELESLLAQGLLAGDRAAAARAQLDDVRAELRRTWCVRSVTAGGPCSHDDPVGELLGPLPYCEGIAPWLVAGGRELVVAAVEGAHIFLGLVSLEDGRLQGRRYLRTPEPLGMLISTTVDGDALWLAGDTGRVLQVLWTTGEPVRWLSLAAFLVDRERIERVFLLPGCAHLWFEASIPGGSPSARVIEVETWRLRREIPDSRYLQPLVAGSASCVFGTVYEGGAVRYTERGALAEELAACVHMHVSAVTIDPAGELVVLGSRLDGGGEIEILRNKAGRTIHRQTLPESSSDRAIRCASARTPGLLVVHHNVDLGDARLAVFRFADPELAPAYTLHAPPEFVLAQDGDAMHLAGLWDSSRGVEIARLGTQPPALGDVLAPLPDPLPDEWSAETSIIRQLREVIATADTLLAAQDPEAALRVMRRRIVTRGREWQSTARLAAAWLAIDPPAPEDRFDKAIALARLAAFTTRPALDLPIPGAWSREQLTAVADQAAQWLAAWQDYRYAIT